MADKTRIEWTDATWNPVTGCTKVSAGCKHCYAERDWARLSANPQTRYYGREFTDVQCHPDVLDLPLRWTIRRRIFVNSMSDMFHPDVPDRFIDRVFAVMSLATRHTFQVLTKRPGRAVGYLTEERRYNVEHESYKLSPKAPVSLAGNWPLKNVHLGVSIEDQATADERIPLLLQTPAAVRWISAEPLLGAIDLTNVAPPDIGDGREYAGLNAISHHNRSLRGVLDWVVAGGESGPKARPMHPDWVRGLRDQCAAASVPFLFKQWGAWAPQELWDPRCRKPQCAIRLDGSFVGHDEVPQDVGGHRFAMVGKKLAGRLLDGVENNGYPEPS